MHHIRQYYCRGGSSFTKFIPDTQNTGYHGRSYAIFNQSRWHLTVNPAPLMSEGFLMWTGVRYY